MDLDEAHRHCKYHRAEIESSTRCGCFFCLRCFQPTAIREWIDQGITALCPYCGIDSVVGSTTPLEDPAFLPAMKAKWFGTFRQANLNEVTSWREVPDGTLIRDEEEDFAIRLGSQGAFVFLSGLGGAWKSWEETPKFEWMEWELIHRGYFMLIIATGLTGHETGAELQRIYQAFQANRKHLGTIPYDGPPIKL